MSRIGNKPIPLPQGVKIALKGREVEVQGPKGKLNVGVPHGITVDAKGAVWIGETVGFSLTRLDPDSGKFAVMSEGLRFIGRENQQLDYWEGE